jgi:hypothetical protein
VLPFENMSGDRSRNISSMVSWRTSSGAFTFQVALRHRPKFELAYGAVTRHPSSRARTRGALCA